MMRTIFHDMYDHDLVIMDTKLEVIPRKGEYIEIGDQCWHVLHVTHMLSAFDQEVHIRVAKR
jgi:hypothetical protein